MKTNRNPLPNRRQPLTTAPLTPAKRPQKAMKRRRSKPRKHEDRDARHEAWADKPCGYGAAGVTKCNRDATEPDHYLRKQYAGMDDARLIVPTCSECHAAMHRLNGHAHRVNGLYAKYEEIVTRLYTPGANVRQDVASEMSELRHFIEVVSGSPFRFTVLDNWMKDGTLTEVGKERAAEILAAVGITEE